jgi:hypothetical protein
MAAGKSPRESREARVVHRRKEGLVTEADMPPLERPKPRRQEGEQDHLREDAGMTQGGLGPGVEPAEHLKEDAGQDRAEHKEDDKSLIDKAKDKLKSS